MDLHLIEQYGNTIAAVGAGLATLYAGWRWGWPIVSCAWGRVCGVWAALERLRDDFDPEKPTSVPAQLKQLTDQGNARGEQLNAVQANQVAQGDRVAQLGKKIDSVANTQRAITNSNPRVASFDADGAGMLTAINRTFLRWTGLPPADLLEDKWYNAVHLEDRARVRTEWLTAVAYTRRFESTFRLIHAVTGAATLVDAQAEPIPEDTVPCERWQGQMYQAQASANASAAA